MNNANPYKTPREPKTHRSDGKPKPGKFNLACAFFILSGMIFGLLAGRMMTAGSDPSIAASGPGIGSLIGFLGTWASVFLGHPFQE